MSKINCWEFKKCGREPGGKFAEKLGICPAAIDIRAHGLNCGENGGRSCWAIAGTLCGGKPRTDLEMENSLCAKCNFYRWVEREEGVDPEMTSELMELLNYQNFK